VTPVLAVENVSLRFGAVVALEGVSLTVDAGERVALAGPNGAGKTSVLNCISGVERPSSGRILINNRDVVAAADPPCRRAALGVARTLQGLGVVDDLDVLANLLLGRHHLMRAGLMAAAVRLPAVRREEARHADRCHRLAAELDLAGDLARRAGDLPTGARKRVELGRALAMDGSLLLLDEPFAGASAGEVEVMAAAIRRATDAGAAAVVVDHDVAALETLAHRVVTLQAGRVVRPSVPAR